MDVEKIVENAEKGKVINWNFKTQFVEKKDVIALKTLRQIQKDLGEGDCFGNIIDVLDTARWFLLTTAMARKKEEE